MLNIKTTVRMGENVTCKKHYKTGYLLLAKVAKFFNSCQARGKPQIKEL